MGVLTGDEIMILTILKWYSIIWLSSGAIGSLWESIKKRELSYFVGFIVTIPMIIYLIIK